MQAVVFLALAFVSVLSAVLVITQRNSVISAMYLIVTLASQAIIYFLLGATFIGVLQIVVYAGAIMVLFLFVIMLLNLKRDEFGPDRKKGLKFLALLFGIFFTVELFAVINIGFSGSSWAPLSGVSSAVGSPSEVANALFVQYLYPFEIVSILLLVAILGVVVLVKKRI